MTAALPEGRRGQALAVALTLVVLAAFATGVVAPAVAWYHDRAALLDDRRVLARRMEAIADAVPALQRAASASAGRSATAPATLEGASDAVAAAALQEMVQAMAGRAGATLSSLETLAFEPAGTAARRIALRVSLSAPWPVLVALLQAMAEATPRLLIDDLRLQRTLVLAAANATPGGAPLEAGFTVIAFRTPAPRPGVPPP